MNSRFTGMGIVLVLVLVLGVLLFTGASPGQTQQPKLVRIGAAESIFQDFSPAEAKALVIPLNALIQTQTGMPSRTTIVKDTWTMGKELENGTLDIGVLNGFEFAWIQEKYPNLKPLANPIVGNCPRPAVYLVARQDSPGTGCAAFKGKEIALPRGSSPEAKLYLERIKHKDGGFKVCRPISIERTLDEVVQGRIQGAVVDEVSLKNYKVIKPGCAKRLKIVQSSATFPAGAIVYREGGLDQPTLRKFQQGLLTAHQDPRNETVMGLFHLSSFAPVAPDYQQALASIRETYPPGAGAQ
jgi:ABC-type phosphate/phosphonate transport system substrate-binding protein